MTHSLKIAIAQLNPKVGAVSSNAEKALRVIHEMDTMGADIVVFPECYLSGYPAEDLIYKNVFLETVDETLTSIISQTAALNIAVILPSPMIRNDKRYNGLTFFHQGKILCEYHKHHRPNTGVFDEVRIFEQGEYGEPIDFKGFKIAPQICFDIWFEDGIKHYAERGAELVISPNASPFETLKFGKREEVVHARIHENGIPILYLNMVGGQDDLVFDGHSFVMNADGSIPVMMDFGREHIFITEWQKTDAGVVCTSRTSHATPDYMSHLYQALVLGLKDYVNKNGFKGVILGLSGGIDSALCAALAVDAFGPNRVKAYMMPSPYTSRESLEDAEHCAKMLGIHYESVSIEPAMKAFEAMLGGHFKDTKRDITEENIQSRARGMTLMALSNKFGDMVITTGNKSEYAVGYATLYGDMCGGYAPIKDVYKTTVFKLCDWRNKNHFEGALGPKGMVMPERIITKPPSAELRPDQKDEDSLPPYPVLDGILRGLIEFEKSVDELVTEGYERQTIVDVWTLLDRAEYKRRQAAPGTKFTDKAFGKERRYPITNGFVWDYKKKEK